MVETFLAQAKAAKEEDTETLKLLDNPALFIHSLIKQRLLLRSENCKTALEDLDGLSESSQAAYKRSHDIHWTSRPKTANTNVVGVRERINTAPASLGSQWPSDVKQLKVERAKLKERCDKAAARVKELKEKLKALKED
eukprot:CAMPEP_0172165060 /NCGR_PEP_ID=MMETSP1050-20130122/8203_1 /TAXON_ID=233186 /ORGANISM="Cryptomonas curvata, Strain CCAP979/52" /LENGTH=138 /DNA_ID=CAMNT_0012835491 /DNA_START=104 /DNA_END=520 /DNA_ORIENTATION=-